MKELDLKLENIDFINLLEKKAEDVLKGIKFISLNETKEEI